MRYDWTFEDWDMIAQVREIEKSATMIDASGGTWYNLNTDRICKDGEQEE